jgi:PAS domain S-box-containing protein
VGTTDPKRAKPTARKAAAPHPPDAAVGDQLYRQLFTEMMGGLAILEAIPDGSGKPADFRLLEVNPAFTTLTHTRAEDLVGRPISKMRSLGPEWVERVAQVSLTGEPQQYEDLRTSQDHHFLVRLFRPDVGRVAVLLNDITDRVRAAAELRERTAFAETIVASAGEGLIVYDRELRFVVWNPVMEDLTGLSAQDVLGKQAPDVFPEIMARGVRENLDRALAGESPTSREFAYVVPQTGRAGWVLGTYRPHRNSNGEVIGVVASIRNVTARHNAEEALLASEAQFRTIFDNIGDAVAIIGADGRFLEVNRLACEMLGYSAAEMLTMSLQDIDAPETAALITARIQRIMNDGSAAFESTQVRRDRTRIPVEVVARRIQFRGQPAILAVHRDISERKRAEQALRRSEERFRALFEHAADAIFICDLTGRLLEVNRAAVDGLGYTRDELLTMTVTDVAPPEFAANLPGRMDSLRDKGSISFETAQLRRDGTVTPIEMNTALIDLGGEPAVLGIARDISERKRAEAERALLESQLRQVQKMEGIGQLAGGIAHDFNNLLTAIRGYATLAVHEVAPDSDARSDLEQIEQAADRATGLTRQLLAFARRAVLQPKLVDLGEIVREVEPMLHRLIDEDVTLITVTPPAHGQVLADPSQMEQVIINLVVNARDAMPDGGTLRIETADVELDEEFVRQHPAATAGPNARLAVIDTGTGMDEATLGHLFEPFFTTKGPGKGTGLGLATVYGIVRQSGGLIIASSELGQGSTFTVYLPWATGVSEAVPQAAPARPAGLPRNRDATVMVVEDDESVRGFVTRVLKGAGYRIISAPDGAAALLTDPGEKMDLLLTDVVMPTMGGRQVAERLCATRPDLRVLYVSGHVDNAIARQGVLDPGVHYLAKPFTADALVAAVDAELARPTET